MNGYYILAIVFIAVAAGLVVTYHAIRFKLWLERYHEKRKFDEEVGERGINTECLDFDGGRLRWLKNFHFPKFLVAIIIIGIIGSIMSFIGLYFDETARKELIEQNARYKSTIEILDNGDFYKYSGNEIAKETIDIAEWTAKVAWANKEYGKFSKYYAIKDRVKIVGEVE